MTTMKDKYNRYAVLTNTWARYSPENKDLIEIFIEIKGKQSKWFRLRYVDDKPEMWRGPRRGLSGSQQQGPELEKEKDNLGKVEVKKVGEPLRPFQDYDSFWKEITK